MGVQVHYAASSRLTGAKNTLWGAFPLMGKTQNRGMPANSRERPAAISGACLRMSWFEDLKFAAFAARTDIGRFTEPR